MTRSWWPCYPSSTRSLEPSSQGSPRKHWIASHNSRLSPSQKPGSPFDRCNWALTTRLIVSPWRAAGTPRCKVGGLWKDARTHWSVKICSAPRLQKYSLRLWGKPRIPFNFPQDHSTSDHKAGHREVFLGISRGFKFARLILWEVTALRAQRR